MLGWVLLSLACVRPLALHVERSVPVSTDASLRAVLVAQAQESGSQTRSLPDIDQFTADWQLRHSREKHLDEPLPSEVQLLLALPSTQEQTPYWKVIKDTWGNQRDVCLLGKSREKTPGCVGYLVRVFGEKDPWNDNKHKAPMDGFEFLGGGELLIKTKENRDSGKILYMFRILAAECPWATHIAKVDMDAYPYVFALTAGLKSKQGCASDYQYYGHGAQHFYKNKIGCKVNATFSLNHYCPASSNGCPDQTPCWVFNEGGTYILSTSLAADVTAEGTHFDKDPLGIEDQMVGVRIHEHTMKKQACVTTGMFPGAWYHKQQSEVPP